MLESLPGLARGQLGRRAEPADAPLPAVIGLLLQHFQQGLQSITVAGGGDAGH